MILFQGLKPHYQRKEKRNILFLLTGELTYSCKYQKCSPFKRRCFISVMLSWQKHGWAWVLALPFLVMWPWQILDISNPVFIWNITIKILIHKAILQIKSMFTSLIITSISFTVSSGNSQLVLNSGTIQRYQCRMGKNPRLFSGLSVCFPIPGVFLAILQRS